MHGGNCGITPAPAVRYYSTTELALLLEEEEEEEEGYKSNISKPVRFRDKVTKEH